MNGKYQYDWIIYLLEKDEQGLVIELAVLGNDKFMIVATDFTHSILTQLNPGNNNYRQAGFGPFTFTDGVEQLLKNRELTLAEVKTLKDHLLIKRSMINEEI